MGNIESEVYRFGNSEIGAAKKGNEDEQTDLENWGRYVFSIALRLRSKRRKQRPELFEFLLSKWSNTFSSINYNPNSHINT